MIGALIILFVTVTVGFFLWVGDRKYRRKHPELASGSEGSEKSESSEGSDSSEKSEKSDKNSSDCSDGHGEICCGRHLVCEKSLSPEPGEKILYYDDEELDAYAGRPADSYSDGELEEFRDVMTTLRPEELAPWARSLQLRQIQLPLPLRDEFFLLLED